MNSAAITPLAAISQAGIVRLILNGLNVLNHRAACGGGKPFLIAISERVEFEDLNQE
jgi:hypothetical protein